MKKSTAYQEGYTSGYNSSLYCDKSDNETWEESAFFSEENSRQFSPFEFIASDINKSKNPDILWEAYDEGVKKGISDGLKERLASSIE